MFKLPTAPWTPRSGGHAQVESPGRVLHVPARTCLFVSVCGAAFLRLLIALELEWVQWRGVVLASSVDLASTNNKFPRANSQPTFRNEQHALASSDYIHARTSDRCRKFRATFICTYIHITIDPIAMPDDRTGVDQLHPV
jgi:hypothetical protein